MCIVEKSRFLFLKSVYTSYGVPSFIFMKPFYGLASRSEAVRTAVPMDKTSESGGISLMKVAVSLFRFLFNDATVYPLYLLQRLLY
jgi:hypothetical protein